MPGDSFSAPTVETDEKPNTVGATLVVPHFIGRNGAWAESTPIVGGGGTPLVTPVPMESGGRTVSLVSEQTVHRGFIDLGGASFFDPFSPCVDCWNKQRF